MQNKNNTIPDLSKPKSSIGYVWAIIVGAIGFLLYANTIGNGYLLDDNMVISKNLYVQEGISGIPKLFTVDFWYFMNLKLGYYRPLSLVTFAIEHEFFGDKPSVSHFDNALLYGLTGFILCLFLIQFMSSKHNIFAFLISLLFISHPIHTEVVANIKSRDEILSFLNILLMLFCAFRYQKTKKKSVFVWSLIFFYLALLSKETAIVGIILLPLFLYYSGNTIPNVLKKTLPYVGIAIFFFLQKRYFLGSQEVIKYNDIVNYPYTNDNIKIPTIFHIFALCLGKLLIPWPLSYDYSYNQVPASHWTDGGAWLGMALSLILMLLAVMGLIRKTTWGLGLSIIFITLVPSLAFVFLRGGIMAERFLYAPCLGFAILIIFVLSLVFPKTEDPKISVPEWLKNNMLLTGIVMLIFFIYSVETIGRNNVWKDHITLFSNDVKYSPGSCHVHMHYGSTLLTMGIGEKDSAKRKQYFDLGMNELQKAIAIYPEYGDPYSEIGYGYMEVEINLDSALKYYKKSIEISPGSALAYNNIGLIYTKRGNLPLASYYFNKAVEANPQFLDGVKNASIMKKSYDLDVHIFPGEDIKVGKDSTGNKIHVSDTPENIKNFNLYSLKGTAAFDKGDYNKSIKYFKKAAEILPDIEGNLIHLGNSYVMSKRYNDAINTYELVLKKFPDEEVALKNLALSYDAIGQKEQRLQKFVKN